jgi:prepilin-type N-terminal cleavage/methylation domain-containing protein
MKIKSKKRGFSLAEILVAVAIVAVISAVVIPSIGGQLKSGDEGRVQQDLTNIRSGAEQFLADVRRYPAKVAQLVRKPTVGAADTALVGGLYLTGQINRWRGPYVNKDSASALLTGFDATIDSIFTNQTFSGQKFLTLQIANFDTISAANIDLRIDDGAKATGMIQWVAAASPKTTLKFFALPIQ